MKQLLIILGIVALLAVGGLAIANRDDSTTTSNTTPTSTPTSRQSGSQTGQNDTMPTNDTASTPTPDNDAGDTTASTSLTYTDAGFNKATISVASNSSLTVTNNSGQNIFVASDPHPEHTANSELNFGTIAPGESKSMTLTKTGSWGIHNHLDASKTATVIVQ